MTAEADDPDVDDTPSWMRAHGELPFIDYDDARLGGTARQTKLGRPDRKYDWPGGLGDRRQADLAYGLGNLGDPADTPVVVLTEGGFKAQAVRDAGIAAVGLVSASTIPSEHVIARLAGRSIVIWPDNDETGRAFMSKVSQLLDGITEAIWFVHWADAPERGDAADCSPEEIRDLVAAAVAGTPTGGRAWREIVAAWHAPETLSPGPDVPSGRDLSASFQSPADLVARLPPDVEWILRLLIACGAITELVGRAKAGGKSTFLAYAMAAILDGRPFLGQPTMPGPIVLLTEQGSTTLRALLVRTGLSARTDVRILLWRDVRGASWPEIVAAAVAECHRIGARLLVIDTLPAFAGIRGDAENDAGAALAAIEPLQVAAADGLAVLVVRHERKGGGDVGDSGRGSSAFTGAVDIVLRISRQENSVRPTIRTLSALSRFDETPPELVIELTDEGYILLGDEAAVAFSEARRAILDVLPEAPAPGLTETILIGRVGGRKSTVGSALRALLTDGAVTRDGPGRSRAPYVYTRVPLDSGLSSPVPPTGRNGGRQQSSPVSVGERMAEILAPVDEPEDVDDPVDRQVVEALFADFDRESSWVN